MSAAYLWIGLGLAVGLTVPWIVLLLSFFGRKKSGEFETDTRELLHDRNLIGIQQNESLKKIAGRLDERVGVSLRDEFAKSALEGYLTGWENPERVFHDGHQHHVNVAQACYRYADAMLAERGKEEA